VSANYRDTLPTKADYAAPKRLKRCRAQRERNRVDDLAVRSSGEQKHRENSEIESRERKREREKKNNKTNQIITRKKEEIII